MGQIVKGSNLMTPQQTRPMQPMVNVGPLSTTLAQHCSSIGSTYRVCWEMIQFLEMKKLLLHLLEFFLKSGNFNLGGYHSNDNDSQLTKGEMF